MIWYDMIINLAHTLSFLGPIRTQLDFFCFWLIKYDDDDDDDDNGGGGGGGGCGDGGGGDDAERSVRLSL